MDGMETIRGVGRMRGVHYYFPPSGRERTENRSVGFNPNTREERSDDESRLRQNGTTTKNSLCINDNENNRKNDGPPMKPEKCKYTARVCVGDARVTTRCRYLKLW